MERVVTTAAIQFNIALGDVTANLTKVEQGLRQASFRGARLAILPEMWSTGYDYKRLSALAERTPEVISALQELTAELNLVTVGSTAEKENGAIYNTAMVIDRGVVVGKYRKIHLFSTMGEDRFLASGDSSLVVETSVGRLGIAICYDLRFPELFRKMALEGAEILCIPAEWPKPRQEHWCALLKARAIENQIFVAAANCCGIQGKLDFFGMSQLIAPRGEILSQGEETDTVLTADFNFKEMSDYRAQIRCFEDRRPDIYGTLP